MTTAHHQLPPNEKSYRAVSHYMRSIAKEFDLKPRDVVWIVERLMADANHAMMEGCEE